MSSQRKKRVIALDNIRQKENQQQGVRQYRKYAKKKNSSSSERSSDFSEFQQQSKEVQNDDFVPFNKPRYNRQQSFQQQHDHRQNSRRRKDKKPDLHLNKKQKAKQKDTQLISFKKNSSNEDIFHNPKKPKKQSISIADESQPESTHQPKIHRKHTFSANSPQKKSQFAHPDPTDPTDYKNTIFKLKPKRKPTQQLQKQQLIGLQDGQNNQDGIQGKKKHGGVCFEIDKSQFVFPESLEHSRQRRSRYGHGYGWGHRDRTDYVFIDYNNKEELLRRRQTAFRYGQFVRRRNFGYI